MTAVAEGLGHAFCALTESVTVGYLCSEPYAPSHEHGITPIDPELGLPWPSDLELLLSPKDAAAPTLAEAAEQGLLPYYDEAPLQLMAPAVLLFATVLGLQLAAGGEDA